MKGILIEPGKAPVVTALPDTLQGMRRSPASGIRGCWSRPAVRARPRSAWRSLPGWGGLPSGSPTRWIWHSRRWNVPSCGWD